MNLADLSKQYRQELELNNILSNEKDIPNLTKSQLRLSNLAEEFIERIA